MVTRRGIILTGAALGGGLVLGYGFSALDDGDAVRKFGEAGDQSAIPLNAWLKISSDGKIICGVHRAEMGQSIVTTLAMLLAEELDADWNDVHFEFTPVDRDYFNFGMLLRGQPLGDPSASWTAATGTWAIRQFFRANGMSMTIASSSTVDAWDTLRPAGASARQMLLAAAARVWKTDVDRLTTEQSYVLNSATNEKLPYGELAEQAAKETPPSSITLKDHREYNLVGRNPPRLDTPAKVTGTATFGMDVQLPNMLYATVVHSPIAGTRVQSYDSNGAEDFPGVQTVVEAGAEGAIRAVAVVAKNSWQALQAAQQIAVSPATPENLIDSDDLARDYEELLTQTPSVIFTDTAADAAGLEKEDETAFANAMGDKGNTIVTGEYSVPFLTHLCMEPMNCTAYYVDDDGDARLEIWAPTQANSVARDIAAQMSGLPKDKVTLHTTFMGGGFGRRADMDFIEQAVSVALQIPGRPIKLFWSREQDVRHDTFRPASRCRVTGAVDSNGNFQALRYHLVGQSVVASYETRTPTPRGGDGPSDTSVVTAVNPPVYPVPHLRIAFTPVDLHVPAGYWRSVSQSWNSFYIESFMDELAAAANLDPLTFRRQALREKPRHLSALNAVAEMVANSTADGVGYAVTQSHNTVVAHAVEVAAAAGTFESVLRVACAIDCGPLVHPDNVEAQIVGSIADGLSAALYGQIDIREGQVTQGNFDTYRRMGMADCPTIDVKLLKSDELRPGGVGEPSLPGTAPALANAIFAATGKRIRSLPILRALS